MIKVGDLVRLVETVWAGEVGIVTKVPVTPYGMWAVLLTSGDLIATLGKVNLEVING
tara:strand:- start:239 stop:409 length:171 start_codon:yes stop_codon:yes gene_type:complete